MFYSPVMEEVYLDEKAQPDAGVSGQDGFDLGWRSAVTGANGHGQTSWLGRHHANIRSSGEYALGRTLTEGLHLHGLEAFLLRQCADNLVVGIEVAYKVLELGLAAHCDAEARIHGSKNTMKLPCASKRLHPGFFQRSSTLRT